MTLASFGKLRNVSHPAHLVIVTPALAQANNGNWQTAQRWARMLRSDYRVTLTAAWQGEGADAMIALHARRSASSIAAWRDRHPGRPLVVVLTGTDLYRDIRSDADAQRSLQLADRLVVLQPMGVDELPPEWRAKVVVSLQSSPGRRTLVKTRRHLRAVMVGHLRGEKDPLTLMAAARELRRRDDIRIDHIGAPLDAALGAAAEQCMRDCPGYRWLGALPHGQTRRRIQQAHVLVHASRMEGGAHVVIEAITSGTPVIASRIPGNLGLLGADYEAVFDCGDAQALSAWLERARDDGAMLARLRAACARRAPLFEPEHERATLLALLDGLLETPDERPRTAG